MLEDLTEAADVELTHYAVNIYSIESDLQSSKDFLENLRSAIVMLEECCRDYLRQNLDVAEYLYIAHRFREKYFASRVETKVICESDVRRRIIEEKKKKFRELLDS